MKLQWHWIYRDPFELKLQECEFLEGLLWIIPSLCIQRNIFSPYLPPYLSFGHSMISPCDFLAPIFMYILLSWLLLILCGLHSKKDIFQSRIGNKTYQIFRVLHFFLHKRRKWKVKDYDTLCPDRKYLVNFPHVSCEFSYTSKTKFKNKNEHTIKTNFTKYKPETFNLLKSWL